MSARTKNVLRVVLLAVAVAFIVWGIYRGEMATVFAKATRLCLECVGIG